MAERRMFTKKVTDSDSFIELSSSAQALYFHLNQGADDDGFNNQIQNAMFKSHSTIDDLKVLMMKNFIIRFESGVIVIKHWRLHNTLRKDRYTPTNFQEEFKLLGLKDNGSYTLNNDGCQLVANWLPQDSIDKNSIDKNSIDKNKEDIYETIQTFKSNLTPTDYEMINEVIDKYTLEQFEEAIEICKSNNAKTIKYLLQVLKNPIRNTKVVKRPKWMDEDIKGVDLSLNEEQERELAEIIKGT